MEVLPFVSVLNTCTCMLSEMGINVLFGFSHNNNKDPWSSLYIKTISCISGPRDLNDTLVFTFEATSS